MSTGDGPLPKKNCGQWDSATSRKLLKFHSYQCVKLEAQHSSKELLEGGCSSRACPRVRHIGATFFKPNLRNELFSALEVSFFQCSRSSSVELLFITQCCATQNHTSRFRHYLSTNPTGVAIGGRGSVKYNFLNSCWS
jgi:hypothetical protein